MNEYITLALTVASIIIPVFATIYTGYIRIKNENKEEHKPYLALGEIESINHINRFMYYFIILGEKFRKLSREEILEESKNDNNIRISLGIKNIGYGVATNIKFYDLSTSKAIIGFQESSESLNQKTFTTFDISKDCEKSVETCILTTKDEDCIEPESHCILCVYQDLNGNIYDFIIGIDVKKEKTYDFFAYQRSSHSYKKIVSEYKQKYKEIMKKYN